MPRTGDSYFIQSSGPNDEALTRAMLWLHAQAKRMGAPAMIAVVGLQALENLAGWATTAQIFTKLKKDRTVEWDGVEIKLFIPKDTVYNWQGPALVIHGGQSLLDKIDAIGGSFPVLYLPWVANEQNDWVATWGAVDIESPQTGQTTPIQAPDVVDIALDGLTNSVNLKTGISQSNDHKQAVRVLETLYHNSAATSGEDIRQRLIRKGWQPDDAAKVADRANRIFSGRRVKDATGKSFDKLWEYWNTQLSGEDE